MADDTHDQSGIDDLISGSPRSYLRRMASKISKTSKGIVGTAKAWFGIDVAPEEVVSQRYSICDDCELNDCGQCQHESCHCFIGSKVRVASQFCPQGKWLAYGDVQPPHQNEGQLLPRGDSDASHHSDHSAAMEDL